VAINGSKTTLVLILLLALTAGCRLLDGGQMREVPFEGDVPFTLQNGQSAVLAEGDLRITFDSVIRDGRCPSQVNCAEQGAVEILVLTQQAEEAPASHELNPDPALAALGWAPTAVTAGGYAIELQAVEPYPEQPEDLETFDDYTATFVVTEAGGR